MKSKLIERVMIVSAAAALLVCSNSTLSVVAADGVYRTSTEQSYSKTLGVQTIPTLVIIGNARHPGIYVTTTPETYLGRALKLSPGLVLLTLDGYSITSSTMADSWISHRGKKVLPYSYAIAVGGKPTIYSGQVQPGSELSSTLSTLGPDHHHLNGISNGPVHPKLVPEMSASELATYCVSLINDSRKSGGLSPLKQDSSLVRFGNEYAEYMAKNREQYELKSSHSPHIDLNGRNQWQRAQEAGLNNFISENIGRTSRTLGDYVQLTNLHRQMMAGVEGHRENIMNSEAGSVGVGIALGDNRMYVTEEFGK